VTGEHRTVLALHAVHARCRRRCFLATPRERILYDAAGRALNNRGRAVLGLLNARSCDV
jgi:hypothetical protein